MGMGHLWLEGMGHLWLKWVGHLWLKWVGKSWQSELLILGDMLKQKTLLFRGVPFPAELHATSCTYHLVYLLTSFL